jgi:hypothetical protein
MILSDAAHNARAKASDGAPTPTYAHLRPPTPTYAHLRPPTPTYAHLRPPTPTYAHLRLRVTWNHGLWQ